MADRLPDGADIGRRARSLRIVLSVPLRFVELSGGRFLLADRVLMGMFKGMLMSLP